jgi:SAM-dependent methyltransferase
MQTAPGQYLLDWERAQFDQAVANVFGYHALQLGLPELDGLHSNRIPHRWLALDTLPGLSMADALDMPPERLALRTDFAALPFAQASLDLVLLPHTLELNHDPHATLREVARVLVPEGRVILSGLNPVSLWGLRQHCARLTRRCGWGELFLPDAGEFLGYWRLRDWLRLLDFEVEVSSFGCYRPAVRTAPWLRRFEVMDRLGQRWWPILGAVYFLVAVKRVHGLRLLGPRWKKMPAHAGAAMPLAHYHPQPSTSEHHREPH